MPIAMMVSGVGLFLIGAAAFLHDCQSILLEDSCGSTTVESFLSQFNLFYYNDNAGVIVNNLMSLPFSYVLFGMGTAAFIVGGLVGRPSALLSPQIRDGGRRHRHARVGRMRLSPLARRSRPAFVSTLIGPLRPEICSLPSGSFGE
jgi:hypothetical protein